jgi:hypothetical protein
MRFASVVVLLVVGASACPAQVTTLDDASLLSTLKAMGYNATTLKPRDGLEYEIVIKENDNKFVIRLKLSADKSTLWVFSPLDKSTHPENLSGPSWYRLLALNDDIRPAFFAFNESANQLRLMKPMANSGITQKSLAAEIAAIKKLTLDTFPEWALERWPAAAATAAPSVAGTTWQFPSDKKTSVQFFADGRAKFSDSESPARWSQNGSLVTFSINDYTQWTMAVDGESMRGLWRRLKGDDTHETAFSSMVLIARTGGVPSVAGTIWEFPSASDGKKSTVQFNAGGTAKFSDSDSPAKWSQHGDTLVFSVNDFTEWTMTLSGDDMKGSWRRLKGEDTTSTAPSSMHKLASAAAASLPPIPPLKP